MSSYSYTSILSLDLIFAHLISKSRIAEYTLIFCSRPCAVAARPYPRLCPPAGLHWPPLSAPGVRRLCGRETTLQPCDPARCALLAVAVLACVLLALCACTRAVALCRAALPAVLDPPRVDPAPLAVGLHHGADEAHPVISAALSLRIPLS